MDPHGARADPLTFHTNKNSYCSRTLTIVLSLIHIVTFIYHLNIYINNIEVQINAECFDSNILNKYFKSMCGSFVHTKKSAQRSTLALAAALLLAGGRRYPCPHGALNVGQFWQQFWLWLAIVGDVPQE